MVAFSGLGRQIFPLQSQKHDLFVHQTQAKAALTPWLVLCVAFSAYRPISPVI
ncbi:hypothetical protein K504DRAFT_468183 [Pleomassaria siparia CBS 279.74]|uniref:Uncharacterized protein n=1 Tax=Pleomassaria siparia CBS 279.74 TaxID=1314801 RepID=A0A6G1K8V1_9PLEO|nr:hypothetical protein K504DRAFT_468183 [Pleomassaria siparia CBS 279.74]